MKGSIALRKPIITFTLDMALTNITTAAWVQLIAALAFGASALEIFNPSGSPMQISQGTAGNETTTGLLLPYTIPPGGTSGPFVFDLRAGRPITVKAMDANVTTGRLILNFFA